MMEKKTKKSPFAQIPAWALSLMALVILGVVMMFLEDPNSTEMSTMQIIGSVFSVIWITLACFFICMIHPKSVFYTPVICNAVGIMAVFVYVFTDLSTTSEFIIWMSCVAISVVGAIVGAWIGRRRLKQEQPEAIG